MKRIAKIFLSALLIVSLACLALAGCTKAEENTPAIDDNAVTVQVKYVKRGNVILDKAPDELSALGFETGDIVTLKVGEKEYDIPIGTAYTDVDGGNMICRYDLEDMLVTLAINAGDFATTTGIATKTIIDEDPGYRWDVNVPSLTLILKTKKGYLNEYNVRHLARTNVRTDYSELTDAEYANFRAVEVNGMKENVLYRSSTPIDPDLGRDTYALAAMEEANVRSVINLNDPENMMKSYLPYEGSYYSTCNVINPEMNYDFGTEAFAEKVIDCIGFIAENEGPYLIHCKEGKDRTGVLCAIIECLLGATFDEIADDYMLTYYNFYNVKKGDATYETILNNNIVKILAALFRVEDLQNANLKELSTDYLMDIGIDETVLDDFITRLKK